MNLKDAVKCLERRRLFIATQNLKHKLLLATLNGETQQHERKSLLKRMQREECEASALRFVLNRLDGKGLSDDFGNV